MADAIQAALRVVHIVAAVVWVGGGTLWAMVVLPGLAQMGPTLPKGTVPTLGGKVMKVLPAAGVVTLLAGLVSYVYIEPIASPTWNVLMLASLALTVIVLGMVFGLFVPAFKKFSKAMGAPGPPGPEVMALMKRMKALSHAQLALVWLVVVLMVVAVSLRAT